jgi:hypothetical protein
VSLSEGPVAVPRDEGAPPDPGVEAMNRLLESLSRQIAEDIRALPPEPPDDDAAGPTETDEESSRLEPEGGAGDHGGSPAQG